MFKVYKRKRSEMISIFIRNHSYQDFRPRNGYSQQDAPYYDHQMASLANPVQDVTDSNKLENHYCRSKTKRVKLNADVLIIESECQQTIFQSMVDKVKCRLLKIYQLSEPVFTEIKAIRSILLNVTNYGKI